MSQAIVTSVALPNGFDASRGVARLSVFLAVRLVADRGDRLDEFHDFLDWPAVMRRSGMHHVIEVDGAGAFTPTVVSEPPRSDVWRALFRPDTYVRPEAAREPPLGAYVTYPMGRLAAYFRERYEAIAAGHPTRLPPRSAIVDQLRDLMDVALRGAQGRDAVDRHVEQVLRDARERVAAGDARPDAILAAGDMPEGPARDFAQFEAFHHQPSGKMQASRDTSPAALRRLVDFHGALAAIADHPSLLRLLGLVIDVELPVAQVPAASFAQPGRLRALPVWTDHPPAVEVREPWIAYVHDDSSFCVAGRRAHGAGMGDEHVGGLVVLGNGLWDLIQLDVDGAVFKAIGAAASLSTPAPDDPADASLPALRCAGLTLARQHTARLVHEAIGAGRRMMVTGAADGPLLAEQVTRGYRFDVFESRTARWRTLHARRAAYAIPGGPEIPPAADDGFVRRGIRHEVGGPDGERSPVDDLHVSDALCRWDGWSLAVPHPGKAISKDPRAPSDDIPETLPQRVENVAVAQGIPLQVAVSTQSGSLPRLRFERDYRVRLRTVDLAGNSLTMDDADRFVQSVPGLVLPTAMPERYRRLEPLGSPELVARQPLREGESLARLVVRDEEPGCERHIVPPKTSQHMAELHGMFDTAIGTGPGAGTQAAYRVASKEKGSLTDDEVLLSDGSRVHQDVTVRESPAGDYVINAESQLIVPYLPDPLAGGVTLSGVPGVASGTVLRDAGVEGLIREPAPGPVDPLAAPEALVAVAFGALDRWPEILPFRLRLAGGDDPPAWDAADRVLTIHLPRAGRAQLAVSCHPQANRIDALALPAWVASSQRPELADPERAVRHAAQVAAGRAWQTGPAQVVELVHAVQRPVRAPAILQLKPDRERDATHATLTGQVSVHGGSSERVDLIADWVDTVDAVVQDAPHYVRGSAHVLEFALQLAHDRAAGPEPNSATAPIAYDEAHDLVVLREARHEMGDTRHREIRYRAVAASRFREYYPEALARHPANLSLSSAPFEVSVLSSARPAAPHVVSIVPTFGWERRAADDLTGRIVSRRRGGGLRVYLDRPWFSSGVGERLAVVLWPDSQGPPPDGVEPLVTRWGNDPLWTSAPIDGLPALAHFPAAAVSEPAVELAERPDVRVSVAGHDVAYDVDRKLWFCDIEVQAPQPYTPFVRLALARWQPESLPGLELSSTVMAEFAQLTPERAVTIVRSTVGDSIRVALSVSGATYRDGPQPFGAAAPASGGAEVEVTVHRRLAGTRDEIGWIDATQDPGVVVAQDAVPPDENLRWSGHVDVPATAGAGGWRVVIREYERFAGVETRRPVFAEIVDVQLVGVPNVIRMDLAEGVQVLRDALLTPIVIADVLAHPETAVVGSLDPGPGTLVHAGSRVLVVAADTDLME